MNNITIRAPIFRYGDTVINLNFMVEANIATGKVWMSTAQNECECYTFPPEVLKAWFHDRMDYKAIEPQLKGGVK